MGPACPIASSKRRRCALRSRAFGVGQVLLVTLAMERRIVAATSVASMP